MSVNIYDKENDTLIRIAGGTLYSDMLVGTISPFGGSAIPSGYLLCNGQAVSRTEYSELFAVIGTAFGKGDNSTTFNVPDLREAVPKGTGLNAKGASHYDNDGVALGEFVDDRYQEHSHLLKIVTNSGTGSGGIGKFITDGGTGGQSHNFDYPSNRAAKASEGGYSGRYGSTTEVKAVGVNYIIKAKQVAVPADFIDVVKDLIKETTYECSGFLINSYSDKITGFGHATVTLRDGIAKINFSARIQRSDTTDDFTWGLNSDLLHRLIPELPEITPISNNSQLQYFAATGSVLIDLMGYSALAIPTGQFWTPARMYLPEGSVGSWGSSNFSANSYITGTVYGTYTV